MNNPHGTKRYSDVVSLRCTPGEWKTFTLEVRQSEASPMTLRYVASINGKEVKSEAYPVSGSLSTGEIKFYVSNPWDDAATGYSVRNFFYQTFEEI